VWARWGRGWVGLWGEYAFLELETGGGFGLEGNGEEFFCWARTLRARLRVEVET